MYASITSRNLCVTGAWRPHAADLAPDLCREHGDLSEVDPQRPVLRQRVVVIRSGLPQPFDVGDVGHRRAIMNPCAKSHPRLRSGSGKGLQLKDRKMAGMTSIVGSLCPPHRLPRVVRILAGLEVCVRVGESHTGEALRYRDARSPGA